VYPTRDRAVSARCRAIEKACDDAWWVASVGCRRTPCIEPEGEPGNRVAWTHLATMARAFV
jgi:hypothetical protein